MYLVTSGDVHSRVWVLTRGRQVGMAQFAIFYTSLSSLVRAVIFIPTHVDTKAISRDTDQGEALIFVRLPGTLTQRDAQLCDGNSMPHLGFGRHDA